MPAPTPPPYFHPFDPLKPIRVYRRNLPHWRQEDVSYFVTLHTRDALPRAALLELEAMRKKWMIRQPDTRRVAEQQEFHKRLFQRTEYWLEQGAGACPFRKPIHRETLYEALLHFHGKRVDVYGFTIMPNHLHAVVYMRPGEKLEDWLGSVKQFTSRKINRAEGWSGSLWMDEAHDRIVRDGLHLNRCIRYIGRNPSKAGLAAGPYMLWLEEELELLGWSFSG